jgi:predicted metal-dependent phosphoesterase TrpH
VTGDPLERLGRADLHLHTWASDGTASVVEVLEHVEATGFLDVVAITDHERIDAALAGREIARDRGMRVAVIVGEEVTTRGGHLVGLFLEQRLPPWKSLQWSIEAIHDQGGIAIPAHPFVPIHICAQGWALRRLLASDNPAVRPDAIETFNPTALGKWGHCASVRFAREHGLAEVGSSDAHTNDAIASAWSTFPGRTPDELRAAIGAGTTQAHGAFHGSFGQLGVYGRQLRKYARDFAADTNGRIRRNGTGRDLGYPGGTERPPRFRAG